MLEADDVVKSSDRSTSKFLQAEYPAVQKDWSDDEVAVVRKAMKSASAFAQVHNGNGYEPAYQSQSGEIVGVIKQMLEEKEAEKADTDNLIAEAKEDLGATEAQLIE